MIWQFDIVPLILAKILNMEVLTKLPPTLAERLELEDEIRYPASFDEFWETLEECQYKVEYHNGQIVSIMSYASNKHELLTAKILGIFFKLFDGEPDYYIFASNRPILKPDKTGVYEPDAYIVVGAPQLFQYDKGKNANTNPAVVVEIQSKTTRDYDWDEKLPANKQIPSVQQIIFIDSQRQKVSIFRRMEIKNQWLNMDFFEAEDNIPVLDAEISVKELYRKVSF